MKGVKAMFFFHFQFHFGYKEVILFDKWSIDSIGGLIASMLVIAAAAACYEGLKYYREYLFWKTYNSLQYRSVSLPDKAAVVNNSNEDTTRVKYVYLQKENSIFFISLLIEHDKKHIHIPFTHTYTYKLWR